MVDSRDLEEEVDLDAERRRFVEGTYARLESLTYYELLGVTPEADRKLVKQAYFRLVTIVHTDRYFGKRLGRYKPMMEAIFGRLTLAADTLSNPTLRDEYDESIGAPSSANPSSPTPLPPSAGTASSRQPATRAKTEAQLAEERRLKQEALKKRMDEARARAREHANAGARAQAAGDFERAVTSYRLALTILPDDVALRAAYQAVARASAERLADSFVRQAALEERYGHWKEAVASWRKVLAARPDDAEAKARLEKALAKANVAG